MKPKFRDNIDFFEERCYINIMRKTTEIAKDYIGAFVGHMPGCVTHPDEDRYLTIRECLHIMGMPSDFQLQGGKKNLNMIGKII